MRITFESAHLFNVTQHVTGTAFFFFFFLTGRSRNEISPCSSRESYIDVVKLIPGLTRVSPVADYLNKFDRPNKYKALHAH